MIQFILMLLGLAFGNNNANTSAYNDSTTVTVKSDINPGTGIDPDGNGGPGNGNGGSTGGNTGQNPPPFTNPY